MLVDESSDTGPVVEEEVASVIPSVVVVIVSASMAEGFSIISSVVVPSVIVVLSFSECADAETPSRVLDLVGPIITLPNLSTIACSNPSTEMASRRGQDSLITLVNAKAIR